MPIFIFEKIRLYDNRIDTPNRKFDFVLQYKNDITDDKLKNIVNSTLQKVDK